MSVCMQLRRAPSSSAMDASGEQIRQQQQQLSMLYNYDYVCKKRGCWDTGAGLKWGKDHDGMPGGGHVGGQIPYYPFATPEQVCVCLVCVCAYVSFVTDSQISRHRERERNRLTARLTESESSKKRMRVGDRESAHAREVETHTDAQR